MLSDISEEISNQIKLKREIIQTRPILLSAISNIQRRNQTSNEKNINRVKSHISDHYSINNNLLLKPETVNQIRLKRKIIQTY